jgi:hypothetical protein
MRKGVKKKLKKFCVLTVFFIKSFFALLFFNTSHAFRQEYLY